ncbi:MAG: PD-(D/E)XK nuclease family protein [Lachnospiraceae bacterium]|nr:PD-(D/E)XK nuclease family protein [Lachnospiraceae bacterium]
MKLRFVIGGSGSGKSSTLQDEIIRRAEREPGRQFIVVVPDQFTMQTQKEMVERHPARGIMNIDVQSFGRLCHRISDEVGDTERIVLDDTGKNLIIKHLASDLADELPVIGSSLARKGYVHEVKSVISEFMQYGIGPGSVGRLSEYAAEKKALSAKLKDIEKVYEAFSSYLGERYITKEEKLDILAGQIEKSRLLKGSVVAFDGFTGFTPVQENVILKLMEVCEELIFTIIMPPEELDDYRADFDDHRLFALSMKTMRSLEQLAKNAGAERGEDILLGGEAPRFKASPALAFLDKHIFRNSDEVYKDGTGEQLSAFVAVDPRQEIAEIFRRIKKLTREGGLAYRDIAVITGDLERYSPYVAEEEMRSGIPCFVDINQKLEHNPFTEYLRAAMECVDKGYAFDNVMHFLRSGLSGIDPEAADELEDYLLATGIRGSKAYSRIFARRPAYMKDDDEALLRVNETRQLIWDKTEGLREPGSRAAADVYAKALYRFILDSDAYESLVRYSEYFTETGDQVRRKEYDQVYEAVCHLLEQTATLLEGEEISFSEFIEIFLSGLEEIKLGVLPMDVDRVVIGDMERTRLKPVKVVFFAGLNDGIIPAASTPGGMISDIDREFLEGAGFALAPTPRQRMFIQRLYLYHALGRPSRQLVLSYSATNSKGESIRPSYLISLISEMFPGLKTERAGRRPEEMPDAGEMAIMLSEYAAGTMPHEELSGFHTDYDIMREREPEKLKRLTESAFYRYVPEILSRGSVSRIYGDTIKGSVSRMESFAACAYAHYLSYGLKLKERESNELQSLDMGSIYHDVLERFGKTLDEKGIEWAQVKAETIDALLPGIMEAVAAEYGTEKLYQDALSAYTLKRMTRILRRSILTVGQQLAKGTFKPVRYEYRFERDIEPAGGVRVHLSGKIDRVDEYTADGKKYIKITDYKSGNRSLKPEWIYSGEQLQLPVYLYEALRAAGEGAVPAALFYYILSDPMISIDDGVTDDLDRKLLKTLKPRGLISNDDTVINALDTNFTGWSDVMAVQRSAGGAISANSKSAMSPDDIRALTEYAEQKLMELGQEMLKGVYAAKPLDSDKCKYCSHRDECMFDMTLPGCINTEESIDSEEAMIRIRAAVSKRPGTEE